MEKEHSQQARLYLSSFKICLLFPSSRFLSGLTLELDGAGLFCGVLQHLLNRGDRCPKVLVATHFHDVFHKGLLDPSKAPISFRHMQVMFTSSNGLILDTDSHTTSRGSEDRVHNSGPGEKITYLYRLVKTLTFRTSCSAYLV